MDDDSSWRNRLLIYSLVRFGAPIAAALIFLVCTAYTGQIIASWFSHSAFPHQRVLP